MGDTFPYMESLADYGVSAALKDGTPVWVRAIRPEDRDTLGAAFAQLSERSVYHRFFQSKPRLSQGELRYLTELDFVGHVGLFVLLGDADSRELMGVARFVRIAGTEDRAEVAFTVADGYQGRGVGTLLLRHLILLGLQLRIRYFEADVLSDNPAMLKVFEHSGAGWSELARDRMIHVTLDLGEIENESTSLES